MQSGRDFKTDGFWPTRLVLVESFEGAQANQQEFTVSGGIDSPMCGSTLGSNGLRFFSRSSVDRFLETRYWDVSSGGEWQFSLMYADGTSLGCYALQNSLVSFQYRLATSTQWVTIETFPRRTFMYERVQCFRALSMPCHEVLHASALTPFLVALALL